MKKIDTWTKSAIAIVVVPTALLFAMVVWSETRPTTVYQFELSEISDGVYAYMGTVVSPVQIRNCTIATVCDKNGNIFTIRGTVKIVNQNDYHPYAVWEDRNHQYDDMITIYAPIETVEYIGAVSDIG